jgi:hypothetical protein
LAVDRLLQGFLEQPAINFSHRGHGEHGELLSKSPNSYGSREGARDAKDVPKLFKNDHSPQRRKEFTGFTGLFRINRIKFKNVLIL